MHKEYEKIATDFSLGNFESTFQFLSDDVTWNIIGENIIIGKSDVIANCKRTSEYFSTVETKFTTLESICDGNKVVIIGTAEFLRDGNRISFIHASDFYEFNENGKIKNIKSFCISKT